MKIRSASAAALTAAAGILVLGCAIGCTESRGDPPPANRHVGLRWEDFPDIAFPPGWKPLADEGHVAVAVGGGSVRRLQLAVQAPAARDDLEPEPAMSRYVSAILPEGGWSRVVTGAVQGRPGDLEQLWQKGHERLSITASREDGLAVLRYRLNPAP